MKKIVRIAALCLALLLFLAPLTGCSALVDLIIGNSDYKAAGTEDAGFLLTVPYTWVCSQSVVWDGAGFTYLIGATLSNSAEDRSNVSVVTYATDKAPEEYFAELYEAQKDTFASVTTPSSNEGVLAGTEGVKYEYEVTLKGEKATVYRIYQLLVKTPTDGRLLVFTYTAKKEFYDDNFNKQISPVMSAFAYKSFKAPSPIGGDGVTEISGEGAHFAFSVPGTWYNAMQTTSNYCKVLSPDGKIAVVADTFIPTADTLQNHWEKTLLPELTSLYGETLKVTEEMAAVPYAGGTGRRFQYRGKAGGKDYYCMQIYASDGRELYCLSFTSTEPIDPESAEIKAITDSYRLK